MNFVRLQFDLLPFIKRMQEHEVERASRARKDKRKRVKKIPIHFPSVNTMYPINRHAGRKYLSDEGRIYKEYISECLDNSSFKIPPWYGYNVTYVFYMTHDMMYTKSGDVSQHDVSNYLKGTEDALFEWILESDANVFDVHGSKRMTVDDPKVVILLSEGKDGDPVFHGGTRFDPYELEMDGRDCNLSVV